MAYVVEKYIEDREKALEIMSSTNIIMLFANHIDKHDNKHF